MATIVRRTSKDGTITYLVRVRRKGAPPQTAIFPTRRDAMNWAHVIKGGMIEGRHFPTQESKRHTVEDMISRYMRDVLPHKKNSTARDQVRQLEWWKRHL